MQCAGGRPFAGAVASDITARPTASSDSRPRSPSGVADGEKRRPLNGVTIRSPA